MVHWLVEQKMRLERGKSWVAFLQNLALMLLLFQSWGFSRDLQILLTIVTTVGLWTVGYLDQTRLFGWQHENEYATNLNPVMVRIDGNTKKALNNEVIKL